MKRRCEKPQTPAMLRNIHKTMSEVTEGGIHLPSGVIQFKVDEPRIQRVAIKIVRGLHFIELGRFLPRESCVDIRWCDGEEETEFYQLSWQGSPLKGEYPEVLSYRYLAFEDLHLWTFVLWQAVMFCFAFRCSNENALAVEIA